MSRPEYSEKSSLGAKEGGEAQPPPPSYHSDDVERQPEDRDPANTPNPTPWSSKRFFRQFLIFLAVWYVSSSVGRSLIHHVGSRFDSDLAPSGGRTSRVVDCKGEAVVPSVGAHGHGDAEVGRYELTDRVRWDEYSLVVDGKRVFLWSGEFHTWRLPVVDLWLDVMQKLKAAGLNAVSIYVHWGLVNPSPKEFDYEGYRQLQPLFDAAKQTGIWVVVRPGPYINAETTGGGIPGWVTNLPTPLRTNTSTFRESWEPFFESLLPLIVPNQISEGGPIIAVQVENEYTEDGKGPGEGGGRGKSGYMRDLEVFLREGGVVVPLTVNDWGMGDNYAKGLGAPDIYGVDSYPLGFDCRHPDKWVQVYENYHDYHKNTNPSQPFYVPEFQGGAFDRWGKSSAGYAKCGELTGSAFESVFYKNLFAANFKMINLYMGYGGTSWGSFPAPVVYTSYDYGAAISENRALAPKFYELKRQSFFLRSCPEFAKTDVVGNSSSKGYTDEKGVFVTELRNPDSAAAFYVVRHRNSSSFKTTRFDLHVETSSGPVDLKSLVLHGRESIIIPTEIKFGEHLLGYANREVEWAGTIGERDVLILSGETGGEVECALRAPPEGSSEFGSGVFTASIPREGVEAVVSNRRLLVMVGNFDTMGKLWNPTIEGSGSEFGNFHHVGTNETVLVSGPYLVRNASMLEDGSHLALWGDLEHTTPVSVWAPEGVKSVSWNGEVVDLYLTDDEGGIVGKDGALHFRLDFEKIKVEPVKLEGWRFADSLPEISDGYDDGDWKVADLETTRNPYKPFDGKYVLSGCEYGFCEGNLVWRGHFEGSTEHSVELSIHGGEGSTASVWLNDIYLGPIATVFKDGRHAVDPSNQTFVFPPDSVKVGADNVVTVLQDNMGMDQTEEGDPETSKHPRGIRGYRLLGGNGFGVWKVAGKKGGYDEFPDKVRGIVNEGGLHAERHGWHLPEFKDDRDWPLVPLDETLRIPKAGVRFFRTTFDLDVPEGWDVMMSFEYVDDGNQEYRSQLYVNGWMMGKRAADLGPQTKFPVHEGILNYHGSNTIAISLWSLSHWGASISDFRISIDKVLKGGVGPVRNM